MVKEITEKINSNKYGKPQYLAVDQLEYTSGHLLIYGGLVAILLTLGVTYIWLLAQKIKN